MCDQAHFCYHEPTGLENDRLVLELEYFQTAEQAAHHVPTYRFRILRKSDAAAIGGISLKVGHSGNIYYVGNIGYEIYGPYRGHGYAGTACGLLLPFARLHGMDSVILTCDPDNVPSLRTIEGLGGALLETVDVDPASEYYRMGGRRKRRYQIII